MNCIAIDDSSLILLETRQARIRNMYVQMTRSNHFLSSIFQLSRSRDNKIRTNRTLCRTEISAKDIIIRILHRFTHFSITCGIILPPNDCSPRILFLLQTACWKEKLLTEGFVKV